MNRPSRSAQPATPQHQLALVFNAGRLQGLSPAERRTVVVQLAVLLLEAAGLAAGERDDGEH